MGDNLEFIDDDLSIFLATGAAPLPTDGTEGYVECEGARIWYASYGSGFPVILLHGGLGHSGNFGHQVPALLDAGYRVVVIDSRGHGRSTRDSRPYTYHLMASDVRGVMDALNINRVGLVGWSDGACIAMVLASLAPERTVGVFFFACNMDPSGTKPFEFGQVLGRCFERHTIDYSRLSATPDKFEEFSNAVEEMMKTEPNFSVAELSQISVPVAIVRSENDEFIKPEHGEYLAQSIPNAQLIDLKGVSHFAPLQRPAVFNAAVLEFLGKVSPGGYI